jgi:phospho-N-acetylmuramoyl-pentapeptide-transferase
MLDFLSQAIGSDWGPARLLSSYLFLASCGVMASILATLFALPKLWARLPRDRGRAHAVDAEKSIGKPLGAGIYIVSIFVLVSLVFIPFRADYLLILGVLLAFSAFGLADDRKQGGLSEIALGSVDLVASLLSSIVIFGFQPATIWLPFLSGGLDLPAWLNLAITTAVMWLAINAMNCNDGVDGLSGSLACVTLAALGILLYIVVGNARVSEYLLIPHNPAGANWALAAALMIGCLFGYLWHNAPPSAVLMGDAGSRPIGLLIGILITVALNPFLLVVCGFLLLANGATGLAKVALIRVFKISVFKTIRFPLHDHARKNLGWSGAQVLLRFILMHIVISALLVGLLLKVR